jgi:hypothetical protein
MDRAQLVLTYGETDTGKSAQLGRLARWHFDRTGEISRLISADSGWQSIDEKDIISPENPEGILECWNVQALADPWSPLIAITEGEWPKVVIGQDGALKLRMVKPSFKDGRILGPGGRVVGQYFFEGISTFGNTGLQDHIKSQRQLGQDLVGKFISLMDEEDSAGKVTQKSMTFAKAAPSHYGQVQDFILLDMVPRTGKMPVTRVVWTGHEAKGTDEITGQANSVLGPATVGKATVDKTVQKFGHSFHLTSETTFTTEKPPRIIREFKAWFVKHPDPVLTKLMWPTKISLTIPQSQELMKRFPGGFIPLTSEKGIEQFFEFLEGNDKPKS